MFRFQSLRSGSSGNCLMFWTAETRILVDCGLRSQRLLREVISRHAGSIDELDAVVVSHAHTDHINYSALRVLEEAGIPLWLPEQCAEEILVGRSRGMDLGGLRLYTYKGAFRIGDLDIEPVEVEHEPFCPTYGFVVSMKSSGVARKAGVVTDFRDWDGLVERFAGADFIYVEANHDPELLRLYPNPNSWFHMMNEHTGAFLCEVVEKGRIVLKTVMLGHLSEERNTRERALDAVTGCFRSAGVPIGFRLLVAPRHEASAVVDIATDDGLCR